MTSRLLSGTTLLLALASSGYWAACSQSDPGQETEHQSSQTLAASMPIYSDALEAGWQDWSWATTNMASTGTVDSGKDSIAVTFGAWTGLYLHHTSSVDLTGLTSLTFRANGGTNTAPALWIKVAQNQAMLATKVDAGKYCTGGSIPSKAWTTCTVPLSALGAGTAIDGIVLQEAAGKSLAQMFIDGMQLVGSAPAVPAAPSNLVLKASGTGIALTWNAVTGATGYHAYRATAGANGPFTRLDASTLATASTTDSTAVAGTTYWYAVTAVNAAGESPKSQVVSGSTTALPVSVTLNPVSSALLAGAQVQFTATVANTSNTSVTWSVTEGAAGGTVSASGLYKAPATAGTFHVVAKSVADTTKSATASVTVTLPVSVAINPTSSALPVGWQQPFTATVSNTSNTAVTWSVTEGATGGTVSATGMYTAPAAAGTFHVVAKSVADTTKSATATLTVTPPVSVALNPAAATTDTGGQIPFTATVSNSSNKAVTWSVTEGAAGGTVSASGLYAAPAVAGTFHVVARSAADTSKSASASVVVTTPAPPANIDWTNFLTSDRGTTWNPGMMSAGGIPVRNTICATVTASGKDDTAAIQAAVDGCPAGQVVKLAAGTFTINGGNYVLINKGITLRGAGAGYTTLQKTDGAKPGQEATGANPSPLIIVGPARWSSNGTSTSVTTSTNLSADAAKGSSTINVASTTGFKVGQIVLLDEASGAAWQSDPAGRGQIWASADWRVVYQRHNPGQGTDDPFPDAFSWFSRSDRPTAEVKEIASISGNTVTFSSPVHISYRTSHAAQLSYYGYTHTKGAGVEDLKMIGGDQGNLRFEWANQSWAARVENTVWHDEGIAIEDSFRIEIRDSYVHDAAWAQPGGAGYAISLSTGSAENLIENNIIVKANKVMVARSAGAGSVFGYNYVDDGYINTNLNWVEVGLNASHMVGPHHVLFEGNYGFNWDSDKTHGNAIYHTIFRNYLPGVRRDYPDTIAHGNGPLRCAGAGYYSYWHSFVGNVLGVPGAMAGWVYESSNMSKPAVWLLGWDDWNPYPSDAKVVSTTLRHGNLDYVTGTVHWDAGIQDHGLPSSLYLKQKPGFFTAGKGYAWPWVDPTAGNPVLTLPAKARYDAGTPFTQP